MHYHHQLDFSNQASFESIPKWLNEIREHSPKDVVIFLVGNNHKNYEERQISTEQGEEKAKNENIFFIETDTKTGAYLDNAFYLMMNEIEKVKKSQNHQ